MLRKLDNGLTVVLEASSTSPVVAFQVWVGVGSSDEGPDEAGLAHLHEHMLFKGTERRGVGEIAAQVEAAGGEINAWTSLDQTVYHLVIASRYFDEGLDILADTVQNASFPEDELIREIEVVVEEIKRSEDHPFRLLSRRMFESVYLGHPYGLPIIGSEESVRGFSREQILAFFHRWYVSDNMVVVAVGDFDPEQAFEKIARAFSGARRALGPLERADPRSETQDAVRTAVVPAPFNEVYLQMAWPIPRLTHPDVPALDLLAVIMGQGESSRFNQQIKRDLRLANEVYSYAFTPRLDGFFAVGASLSVDRIEPALAALQHGVTQVVNEAVSPAELAKAKTMIESDLIYSKETVQGLARKLGFYQAIAGSLEFEQDYYQRVQTITPEQLQTVAARYLRPERLNVGILHPRTEDEGAWTAERIVNAVNQRPKNVAVRRTASRGADVVRHSPVEGLTLLVKPDPTIPLVSVRAAWLGGLCYEGPAESGINNLLAALLTRGTRSRNANQIARQLDEMAGSVDGVSGRNSFGMRGEFLSRSIAEGMELFVDCLHNSTFSEPDLGRERELILEEIRNQEDNFAGLTFREFGRLLYGNHPYGRDVLGESESVSALTQEQLGTYYSEQYRPGDLVLVMVGDVDPDWAAVSAQRWFADAPPVMRKMPELPPMQPLDQIRSKVREKPSQQCHIALGFLGTTIDDPDRYALEVLCTILSGQGGRLFRELRDRRSLAYSISAFNVEGLQPGYIAFYAGTSPDKVQQMIDGIRREIQNCVDSEPSAVELARARHYLVGTHDIGLQRRGSLSAVMAFNELYGLSWDHYLRYADHVESVTTADVRRVARRFLNPDSYALSIVGPPTSAETSPD